MWRMASIGFLQGCMALLLGGLGKISRGVGDNQGIVAGFVVLKG